MDKREVAMPLYSVTIELVATAYIKAASEKEARNLAHELSDAGLELPEGDWGVEISGKCYDDPDLPKVSLSPVMTVLGPYDTDSIELVD